MIADSPDIGEGKANLAPGAISDRALATIEDTMNATMRECVFVSHHLDAGSVEDALNSLLQIELNAQQVTDKIGKLMRKAKR